MKPALIRRLDIVLFNLQQEMDLGLLSGNF